MKTRRRDDCGGGGGGTNNDDGFGTTVEIIIENRDGQTSADKPVKKVYIKKIAKVLHPVFAFALATVEWKWFLNVKDRRPTSFQRVWYHGIKEDCFVFS